MCGVEIGEDERPVIVATPGDGQFGGGQPANGTDDDAVAGDEPGVALGEQDQAQPGRDGLVGFLRAGDLAADHGRAARAGVDRQPEVAHRARLRGGQLSFAGFSAYSATKFALEGLSEALADEVKGFGIKVLVVEPGSFRTNLFGKNAAYFSASHPAYADTVGGTEQFVRGGDGAQAGDPAKAAAAILAALDADETPLRLPLGGDAVDAILAHLDGVRGEIERWEKVSRDTAFDE
ncbi:short subunit dehydrogenase [Nocardia puris]|uniref:Short subunit dehydrogenase n=1 Tax=Nocardia puris TaxID=208602 RepID=A0A366DZ20_9NOCA|nr:short subunit dehydrogenase [Nocardia puris]